MNSLGAKQLSGVVSSPTPDLCPTTPYRNPRGNKESHLVCFSLSPPIMSNHVFIVHASIAAKQIHLVSGHLSCALIVRLTGVSGGKTVNKQKKCCKRRNEKKERARGGILKQEHLLKGFPIEWLHEPVEFGSG